jgi:hypothetical protein
MVYMVKLRNMLTGLPRIFMSFITSYFSQGFGITDSSLGLLLEEALAQ